MATSLSCHRGIHLYATNGGSFTNVGMPPTREKGSHLPPRTTKLCNLRNGRDSNTAPTVNQIWDSLLSMKDAAVLSPTRDARNVTGPHYWGGTGTLVRLVDSHTMLVIYPTHAICYRRVVICASLDTRF